MASRSQCDTIKVLMHGTLTQEFLKEYFTKFGTISQIHSFFEPPSTHRCGTYITFTRSGSVTASLRENDILIKGIRVQISPQISPPLSHSPIVVTGDQNSRTVKVSMFDGRLTEEQLNTYFSAYGPLSSTPIVREGNPIYSYINFQNHEAALRACDAVHDTRIAGVEIKARLFEPKNTKPQNRQAHSGYVPQQPPQSLQYPDTWLPQQGKFTLADVGMGTKEWNDVSSKILATMPRAQLVSVQRIQNKDLWDKYAQKKQKMIQKGRSVNEKQLFHGTSKTPPDEIYEKSEHGFDFRFSKGMWGLGSYFAVNGSYSDQFSYKLGDGRRQLIMATVLTGDSCWMKKSDDKLRMPPHKPGSQNERYDSVSANLGGSDMFIVYEFDSAYPEYLITYTQQ